MLTVALRIPAALGKRYLSVFSSDKKEDPLITERRELRKKLKGLNPFSRNTDDETVKAFETELLPTMNVIPKSLQQIEVLTGEKVPLVNTSKPTALLLAFNQLSWLLIEEWRENLPSDQVNPIQCSVVDSIFTRLFTASIKNNLKREVPENLHSTCAVISKNFEAEKKFFQIETLKVPYVFIIDTKGRLRWRSCGSITNDDRTSLLDSLVKISK